MEAHLSPAAAGAASEDDPSNRHGNERGGDEDCRLSLWWDGVPTPLPRRAPLPGNTDVDVAIVGGGFTGLWTAYYLAESAPGLKVVVLEREMVGFGASGRNGGWCSALFAASVDRIDRRCGPGTGAAMRRAMVATVDEIERICAAEPIDCGFARGGTVTLARTPAQWQRARDKISAARGHGLDQSDLRLLDAAEASEMARATDVLGGVFTPHCAAVDPVRLVRGLAGLVEGRGAVIREDTAVTAVRPGAVETDRGTVTASTVVLATEGYTATIPGEERTVAPVYSLMIATEPLDDEQWQQIGLARRQTFNDFRHLIIYGQRTEDGRLAFGGRGAPYHFGSSIRPAFDRDPSVHDAIQRSLVELFPSLAGVAVTHRWGGPIGIHRDWFPSVGLDRSTGLASAGGYVGDGVTTTNLAGRTLRDLILGRPSVERDLAWVGHRSRRWEPEPLRYLGINAGLHLAAAADRSEQRAGRPTGLSRMISRLTGG